MFRIALFGAGPSLMSCGIYNNNKSPIHISKDVMS